MGAMRGTQVLPQGQGKGGERTGEAAPCLRIVWQPEAQPFRVLGERAHEEAASPEMVEQLPRRWCMHQPKQCGAADHCKPGTREHLIEPMRLAVEHLTGRARPGN